MEIIALVPAFNEAPRIAKVLDILTDIDYINSVYVIDDGSIDKTSEVAEQYNVILLRYIQNLGKGAALQTAIRLTSADYYLFIDADLIGLTAKHIDALIEPLFKDDKTVMSIGTFKRGGKTSVNLAQKYFYILNGQRCLRGSFAKELPDISWTRFGVEVFISKYAAMKNYKVCYPDLTGLTHYRKEEKMGFMRGFLYRLQMYREILHTYKEFQHHV